MTWAVRAETASLDEATELADGAGFVASIVDVIGNTETGTLEPLDSLPST